MKLNKLLVAVVMVATSVSVANAALENSNFIGGDNSVKVIEMTDGVQFNLQGGTTNLNWNKFNVGKEEVVDYHFYSPNSTAINQIDSIGGASVIAGKIFSTGAGAATSNIIINNAAGVSFVNGAMIDVGSMIVNSKDGNIDVSGLDIKNGNLSLNTDKGQIEVKGLAFDKKGNLHLKSAKGDIVLAAIKNAATIKAEAGKNIFVKGSEHKVGNVSISGITTDYLKLATTNNGEISVEDAKVTVGKDFIVLTKGSFVDDNFAQTSTNVNKIVTKNGEILCVGFGGDGSLKIANSQIKNENGVLKVFSNKVNVADSKITNLDVENAKITIQNSTISDQFDISKSSLIATDSDFDGNLNIAMKEGYSDNSEAFIKDSTVKNLNMEGNRLDLINTSVRNLSTTNVNINAIADAISTLGYLENSNIKGGSLTAKNYILNNVKTDFGGFHIANSWAGNIDLKGSGVSIKDSNVDSLKVANTSGLTIDNVNFGSDVKLNWVGKTEIKNQNRMYLEKNSVVNGDLSVLNSNLNLNNLRVANGRNFSVDNSTVNLNKGDISGNLLVSDSIVNAVNSTVSKNIYLSNKSNADVKAEQVSYLASLLKNGNLNIGYDLNGQTAFSGNVTVDGNMNNRAVNIATLGDVNIDASNLKSLVVDNSKNTTIKYDGVLNTNKIVAQNVIDLSVDSLINNNSTVAGIINAKNSIEIDATKGFKNLGQAKDETGRAYNILEFDSNFNVYNVANTPAVPVIPVTPVVPTIPTTPDTQVTPDTPVVPTTPNTPDTNTGAVNNITNPMVANTVDTVKNTVDNHVSTSNVKTQSDVKPLATSTSTLASQFAKNVKSLAADDVPAQKGSLKKLNNGFRVTKSYIPALMK